MSGCYTDCSSNTDSMRLLYGPGNSPIHTKQVIESIKRGYTKPDKTFFSKYPGIVGIEVEVEGLPNRGMYANSLWNVIGDGSLKDNGGEFVSIPLQGIMIDYALKNLQESLKHAETHYFNHRCSIHVHINVGNLDITQLLNLFALYIRLEPYYYAFADPMRTHSPFCLPVSETDINKQDFLRNLRRGSQSKYTGFAFNHLTDYGTFELRILEGTGDQVKLRRWIMMLQKMFLYCIENPDLGSVLADGDLSAKETRALGKEVFNSLGKVLPDPDTQWLEKSAIVSHHFITG